MVDFRLGEGIFDGSPESNAQLRRLALDRFGAITHIDRKKVAVACDGMAAIANVVVGPDGRADGLNVPMRLGPNLAAQLMAMPQSTLVS
jgi:hypothetical protein